MADRLGDGIVSFTEMHELIDKLVSFFNLTVWTGQTRPSGSDAYGEYFNSTKVPEDMAKLAEEYSAYFPNFRNSLMQQAQSVKDT